MNVRTLAGCVVAGFVFVASAPVLSTDSPRALARAQGAPPSGAHEPSSADRPPGVPPDRWIQISGALGIVIVHSGPPTRRSPGDWPPPPLEGYFAVRYQGRWWRLFTNAGSLVPLAATEAASSRAR